MAQIFQSSFNTVARGSLASIVLLIVALGWKTYAVYWSLCTTAEVTRLREQLTGPRESSQNALQELEQILPNNSCFFDFEVEQVSPHLGRKRMLLNAHRLEWEEKVPSPMSLLAIEEVTGGS